MNDKPKSIWSRPWKGRAKVLGWLAILTAAVFLFVFGYRLGFEGNGSIPLLILYSLLFSVIISVLVAVSVLFVRWLCCWRNLWRVLRLVLFGAACVITLVALFYAVENWRGQRAWEAHKRQWEAKGEKFTLVQLAPPPVPDDENFALTPLLKPALDYTRGPLVWRDTNSLARLQSISATLLPDGGQKDQLPWGNLDKGTLADLEACRAFYRGNTNYPQPAKSGTAAEDILAALGKFDADLNELREAAATRPYSRFPITYDLEPSSAILLPHLSHLKRLSILVNLRTIAELEAGQTQDALADLQLGFRLSDSMRGEPFLIDHLVRIRTLAITLQGVCEGLARHAWSQAQLSDIEHQLASLNLLAEYKLAMRGERACSTGILNYTRRQEFRVRAELINEGLGGHKVLSLMPGGWFYQNMLTISEILQEFNIPIVDEKTHRVFPHIADESDAAVEKLLVRPRPYNIFARMLMPALGAAARKSARMQTSVDAARVACALERYRLANGKLPENLDALAPRFIETIPTDVIDGKPLRYRLKPDGGYVLYSVGWNQTDEGGEIVWNKGINPSVDIENGDWVWQMPGK